MDKRIKEIAAYYGYEAQSRQLIEEMTELTQAINKLWRIDKSYISKDRNTVTTKIIMETVPIWEKLCLTAIEAAQYSNIGVNKIRKMTDSPKCPFVLHMGRKRLIKRKEFEKFIEKNIEI